jgi:hypothetical protein
LKRHTHSERAELLRTMIVPMLRKELGKNLIAIAADGSFARHEDKAYSDLELMIFVKNSKHLPNGFSKIHDGMLIEGLFVTEKEYYDTIYEPNKEWYIAGSDKLMAITNPRFIKKLQKYQIQDIPQKCDRIALNMLNEIQETFGKLFNAIDENNQENLFPILSDALMAVLRLLAFTNRKPYVSLNSMVSQAKSFKIRPRGFSRFLNLVTRGRYGDKKKLREYSEKLFAGIEELYKSKFGPNIYDDDLSTIKRTAPSGFFPLGRKDNTANSSPLEGHNPAPNSSPLEGEDKGGGRSIT